MVKQTLPCAEKNCKSKMTLTENTDNLLYYNCIKKHDEHTFRYNITQKKWEKIIIKTKLILHYNENPSEEPLTETSNHDNESNEIKDQVQPTANTSNLTETNGKSQKKRQKSRTCRNKNSLMQSLFKIKSSYCFNGFLETK